MPLLRRILQRSDGAPREDAPMPGARTFELAELGSRTYHFPSTFEDVEMLVGRFLLSAAAAKHWLPASLVPVEIAPRLRPFRVELRNHNYQVLDGKLVELETRAGGQLRPGRARVEFGDATRARFPGLPEAPLALGGVLADARLALSLPVDAAP
jgi:hypothetical protein